MSLVCSLLSNLFSFFSYNAGSGLHYNTEKGHRSKFLVDIFYQIKEVIFCIDFAKFFTMRVLNGMKC